MNNLEDSRAIALIDLVESLVPQGQDFCPFDCLESGQRSSLDKMAVRGINSTQAKKSIHRYQRSRCISGIEWRLLIVGDWGLICPCIHERLTPTKDDCALLSSYRYEIILFLSRPVFSFAKWQILVDRQWQAIAHSRMIEKLLIYSRWIDIDCDEITAVVTPPSFHSKPEGIRFRLDPNLEP